MQNDKRFPFILIPKYNDNLINFKWILNIPIQTDTNPNFPLFNCFNKLEMMFNVISELLISKNEK